jgi:hypothetical protein
MKKLLIPILIILASMFLTATPKVEADSETYLEVYLVYATTAGAGSFWIACYNVGMNAFGVPTGETIEQFSYEVPFSDDLAHEFMDLNNFNNPIYTPQFNGMFWTPAFLHTHSGMGWVLESLGPVSTTCNKQISFTEVTSTRHWTFCYDAPLNTI